MAKVTVPVAVFLLLVTVAQARFPFDLLKKPVTEEPETVKATATNLLLLPSEKPESETEIEAEVDTVGIIGWDVEITETSEGGEAATTGSDSDANSDSVTVISFGPANRHFKKRLPFPFSRGHHFHHLHKYEHGNVLGAEEGLRFRGRDAGHGNGMIPSEEGMDVETVIRDRSRLVPGRWVRLPNGNDMRMHHQQQNRQETHHEHEQQNHENKNEHEHLEHDQEKHEQQQNQENKSEHDQEKHEQQQNQENKNEHDQEKHEQQNHENKNEHDRVNVFLRKIRKFLTDF